MRILVTDGMDKAAMEELTKLGYEVVKQFYEPDQLGAALCEFDAVVVRSKTKIRANHIDEVVNNNGKLKLAIRGGVGVDNIDVKYAEDKGIKVRNTPRASSDSVAELTRPVLKFPAAVVSLGDKREQAMHVRVQPALPSGDTAALPWVRSPEIIPTHLTKRLDSLLLSLPFLIR